MGRSQGNLHCAPPLPMPCRWERCLPITLNCPPVRSYHSTTANFRVHESVAFLVNGGERPLLMVYFFKRLEPSPFPWRWFYRCAINRLGHAFHCTQNIFTNGALIPIYSAWNFGGTSSASRLSRTRTALQRVHLHYSSFVHVQHVPKLTSVSSDTITLATLGKNQKGRVCCSYSLQMTKSGTFEMLSLFPERAIDFHDFQEQIR